MDSDDRLRRHQGWIVNAAGRLACMYHTDRQDCEQILTLQLLRGRSHRVAWLKARATIERERLPVVEPDGSCCADLRDFRSGEIELVTRMMDMELILTAEEYRIVLMRVDGQTEAEIGATIGVDPANVSRRLKVIRAKITEYYAS
jgi:DNA-binding CsgD family transcriptional regulator